MQELVVMAGVQGSGKSTWVREHLAATHAVVSKDHWPNARRREARQRRVVAELLAAGHSVVVDNTNPTPEDRAALVAAARAAEVPVRAVWMDTPLDACFERNAGREGRARVPLVGVLATCGRFVPPTPAEGFDRVDVVRPGAAARAGARGPAPVR
ncbi:MAG TPA: ATP-binding protein [Geodermatophilus sp.]|nr:ATP-binding protein [Geodermatophilus sp.]